MAWRRIFIMSMTTVLATQGLFVCDWFAWSTWIFRQPDAFLFGSLCLFLVTLVFFVATKSVRLSVGLLHGPILLLGLASFLKRYQFGQPIYPWDLNLAEESFPFIPFFAKTNPTIWIFGSALLASWILLLQLLPSVRINLSPPRRLAVALSAAAALFAFVSTNPLHDFLFTKYFTLNPALPQKSFDENGVFASYILMNELGEVFPPSSYSDRRFQQLFDANFSARARGPATDRKPDIIVILSESFFDPTLLRDVSWKRDPIAFTRSLADKGPFNLAVVPAFGGKSANTEFEFLTGHSISFFARGAIPYVKLINDHQLSIVDSLHTAGYRAIAIYPSEKTNSNRAKVYERFGFDEFLDADAFAGAKKYGDRIADESLLPAIRNALEKSPGPSFVFVVTRQNHAPFNEPFEAREKMFDSPGLSTEEQTVLHRYSQQLESTDRFHRDLIAYLDSRKSPTVVSIMGNHLPALLPEFGVFNSRLVNSSDPSAWTKKERSKMYTTPLVTWSNFPLPAPQRPLQVSFMGARLLRDLRLPMTSYQNFLARMSDRLPVFRSKLVDVDDVDSKIWIEDYRIFQYGTFTHQETSPVMTGAADPLFWNSFN